jgi:hypothetical protein
VWEDVFNTENNDIDKMFNNFVNTYLKIFHACFPIKKIYLQCSSKQWVTTGIKTSCDRKRELYCLSKLYNSPYLKKYYKTYSKILTNVIKEAKKLCYRDKINKTNNASKATCSIIKEELGKNCPMVSNHTESINPNIFNNYFLNVADNIAKQICTHTTTNSDANRNFKDYLNLRGEGPYPKIAFKNITSKEIEKVIASFPSKNSTGYDEISMKTLKLSAPFISSPLCYIFNNAVLYGKFPTRMKYSIIIPIHKKGDKKNCGNYRPISLLTSFSKIFEKLIFKRISTHIHNYDILAKEQFGFRPKLSTEVASYTHFIKLNFIQLTSHQSHTQSVSDSKSKQ